MTHQEFWDLWTLGAIEIKISVCITSRNNAITGENSGKYARFNSKIVNLFDFKDGGETAFVCSPHTPLLFTNRSLYIYSSNRPEV